MMINLFTVMLSVSETSPGRVFYRGVCVTVKSSPTILPFRVYALPLKRERWHA